MQNPFEYQRVVTGNKFVDREKELKIIIDAMMNGENLILISPRRLGKTSLLKEAMRRINGKRIIAYVDLFDCTNEQEIAEKIANAVINSFGKIEKLLTKLRRFFKSTKPVISIGEKIELKFEFFEKEKTLAEVLKMINKLAEERKKRIVVIIDECQIMAEIEKVESIFRTEMQEQKLVSYIFSGSKAHVLEAMIKNKARPFYRQLRPIKLSNIPPEKFNAFIKRGFSKLGGIDKETLEEIYKFGNGNPQRIQQICYHLFQKVLNGEKLKASLVKETVIEICLSLEKEFETEFDNIKSLRQKQVLKALAIEKDPKPLSNEFIRKYDLGGASSVQSALKGLIEKGLLDENHKFVDPLFKTWLWFKHEGII